MTEMVSARAFFAQRRVAAVRKTHHAGAQAVHGGFKRQACAGRRFKKAAGNHFMLEQLRLWICFQFCSGRQYQFKVFAAEIVYGNDMFLE